MMAFAPFWVDEVFIEEQRLFLIAGPCVLDEENTAWQIAGALQEIGRALALPIIFKASYTKDNRTAGDSYRGPGLQQGLEQLAKIRRDFHLPVLSDVHDREEVPVAAQVLDVLQIPAFLCRQSSLIEAAARTGKAINVKKGQFLAPWDMRHVAGKVSACDNARLFLTERGTCFGYNNLVVDMRSLPIMAQLGYPVVFDGTHSTQLPGAAGQESGGQREMIPYLVRAAVAVGCNGLFLEVHPAPERSESDRASILPLAQLESLLRQVLAIRDVLTKTIDA